MDKKNILVTGANGQLGTEIRVINHKKGRYFFTDIDELDITNKGAIIEFVKENHIQIIINCAAYTQVDKAENEMDKADLINHKAVKNLAEVCTLYNIFLIHISTDYVFDGQKNLPYKEIDTTNPLSVYGKTKLAGEKAVKNICNAYLIIRTSWLYSVYGNNFVKTIQRLSAEKNELKVVFDQVGTPTNAADLADFIVFMIHEELYQNKQDIYHFSNEGVCSWYDFAKEIVDFSGNECLVNPCYSDEYPTKATRPVYAVLDKTKLKKDFGYNIPYWRESLLKALKTQVNSDVFELKIKSQK